MQNALRKGVTIFIDANIFLYKILEHWKYAQPYTGLLKDVNYGKYSGVASVFVLNEVFHRVMIAELFKKYNIDAKYSAGPMLLWAWPCIAPHLPKQESPDQKQRGGQNSIICSPPAHPQCH